MTYRSAQPPEDPAKPLTPGHAPSSLAAPGAGPGGPRGGASRGGIRNGGNGRMSEDFNNTNVFKVAGVIGGIVLALGFVGLVSNLL